MRMWRFSGMLLLLAVSASPCVITPIRKLWAKTPGSTSKLFAFERNGRVGFIDATGKVVIEPTIDARIEDVGDFSDRLARVDRQGYIDETGRWVIRKQFVTEYNFSDGMALASVDDPADKNRILDVLIDRTGAVVAKVPAFRTEAFSEGLAAYQAEGQRGIRRFSPERFYYRDYPGLQGFVDRTGKVVIQARFADVGPFRGGLARAVSDGYCYIATPEGGREGTPTTGYPSSCGGAPDDAVTACKAGFIGRDGRFAIEPRFDGAQDFQDGLAAVRIGALWGFIDTRGEVVIVPQFDQVQSFREGLAAVKIDGKWGFIDRGGLVRIRPQFEHVEAFSDSLAIAYVRGRALYIDRTGRRAIAGLFREATSFVNGLAAVLVGDERIAYIDHTGNRVFEYTRR